jgi:two-component system NtrC family sensor kinase
MPEATILIIDDSSELRSLLESLLPYSGYQAVCAGTGHEGLSLALASQPDLILLDLELPDMTGLQVLEALNQHRLTIPTIMITGYGSEGVAARALRLGALSYLIKPFTTEEVLSSIERALTVNRLRLEKARLTALLEAYTRHFQTLSAIGRALTGGLDRDQFLQRIVEAGRYVTQAERCQLSLLDQADRRRRAQFCVVAARGRACHIGHRFSSPSGDERLWAVLEEGTAVRLQASPGSPLTLQTGDTARAVLQVPLRTQDQVVGLLSVDRQGSGADAFGRHDEQMLAILADYVVLALEKDRPIETSASVTPAAQGSAAASKAR